MAAPCRHLQTPAVQNTMSLPLELAPLVFQFLPLKTLEKFPQNDPLLIAVLKIQEGCRPFKVTYLYNGRFLHPRVEHMGIAFKESFSKEVLLSLGVAHSLDFGWHMPATFASMFCKNDTADSSYPFSRVEELSILCMDRTVAGIDLGRFPKLRKLDVNFVHGGITISPRSRTILLSHIGVPRGRCTVEGVCDASSNEYVVIEMNRREGFMKLSYDCIDWKPCFDRSWCRSIVLRKLFYSKNNIATLQGFPNLKILKFERATIKLSQKWLPNIPLEALSFRRCIIEGREFGLWPLVEKLDFRLCLIEPFIGHFPKLESLIVHELRFQQYTSAENEETEQTLFSVPIAKENLRKVKSFSLSTKARRFDMSSFKELKELEVWRSYQLTHLDGLNADTLERVMIECCPNLKVDFPCHVSV